MNLNKFFNTCSYKGRFSINFLPNCIKDYKSASPDLYIVFSRPHINYGVIILDKENAVIFNPNHNLYRIDSKLIDKLTYLYSLTMIEGHYIQTGLQSLAACIYFLYHCHYFSIDEFKIHFPLHATVEQHIDNIRDFIKVKDPCHYKTFI